MELKKDLVANNFPNILPSILPNTEAEVLNEYDVQPFGVVIGIVVSVLALSNELILISP